MLKGLLAISLPPLLVFGLYHLLTWFNIFRVNERVFWKRLALASVMSHALLATGFFVFSYFDYRANRDLAALGLSYGAFLFNRSEFWRLIAVFDTLAMMVIVVFFSILDRTGIALPGLLPMTIAMTYAVGSVQWYFVGGGVGAIFERFWSGLKTGDEDEEEEEVEEEE